ncbi:MULTISPECIES: DUF4352 domain-containing protein [unclassified Brevibacterium]|uniref:DUF4352 domain-containing protein n=1 Tax=unclassified Brevibacterium TaxID=2614124 RepID=UPI0010F8F913|nr:MULTISPECIES: DUF4352 domain-containing protein [unclassified Brevibacterium]MCM1014025.1 DUF4352 domain-containing protein [Brevibacterium sp. XM4083]
MSNPQNPQQPGPQQPRPQQPGQPSHQGHPQAGQPMQPQYVSPYPNVQGGYAPAGTGPQQSAPHGQPAYAPAFGQPGPPNGQKPAKQKKPLLKRWWFWLIVIVVVIMLINAINGGGGDTTEDTGSTTSQEGSEAGSAEENNAEEQPAEENGTEGQPAEDKAAAPAEYGMGDAVAADGWEITVDKVEDGVSTVGSEYLNTKAQGQFVKVSVSVKNTTSEPAFFYEDNIKLGDDKGNAYSSDSEAGLYADEDSILFLEEINPGNTAEGVLVFDVPKDVSPDRLTFAGGIFSDPVEISLK